MNIRISDGRSSPRILVNTGNALGTGLLLYFLQFGLRDANAANDLLVLVLIYMAFVVLASLVLGRLSDRLGRRKLFVFIASGLQGIAAGLLALVPYLSAAMLAAVFLGLGFGCFLSVDQALATQVLPDAKDRGKDLGIMNIAFAAPQAIAPLAAAGVVAATSGFTVLFLVAGTVSIAGAFAVIPVRSVR